MPPGRLDLRLRDDRGIERLRFRKIEVDSLDCESEARGFFRLLRAARDEDESAGVQRADCFCGAASSSCDSRTPRSLYSGIWVETPFRAKKPSWATRYRSLIAS